MIWGALGILGLVLIIACTWGIVNARRTRQENVLHSLSIYNSKVLGYQGYSVDSELSVVLKRATVDYDFINNIQNTYNITVKSFSVYDKLYARITIEDNLSESILQQLTTKFLEAGYECVEINSTYVACSSEPEIILIDNLNYYDATGMSDIYGETLLKSLQINLYDNNYMIYLFKDGYLIVTPNLGKTFKELQDSNIGSYYYTLCLLRLLADNNIQEQFPSMMEDYHTIVNIFTDNSMIN